MMYKIFYTMMMLGYLGCSIQIPGLKMKIVGILLTIANGIILYKS